MFRRLSLLVPIVLASSVLAADLSEKWSKRLESADATYQQAVQKADNTRFYAVQKATQERLKLLKAALADATKSGDFDAAEAIKSRITAAETVGAVRSKPKNVVKFAGHEYALISERVTWHTAKRLCEEMGGHLAIGNTPEKAAFLLKLCGQNPTWLGASDEVTEGTWTWIDGSPVKVPMEINNQEGYDHWMVVWTGMYHDGTAGHRYDFVCEWDN